MCAGSEGPRIVSEPLELRGITIGCELVLTLGPLFYQLVLLIT